jgi:hypothetical protein
VTSPFGSGFRDRRSADDDPGSRCAGTPVGLALFNDFMNGLSRHERTEVFRAMISGSDRDDSDINRPDSSWPDTGGRPPSLPPIVARASRDHRVRPGDDALVAVPIGQCFRRLVEEPIYSDERVFARPRPLISWRRDDKWLSHPPWPARPSRQGESGLASAFFCGLRRTSS